MRVLEWVFAGSVFLVLYPMVGYPLLVALAGAVRPRPVRRAPIAPRVSILIPAYNEAECIARTLDCMLAQDYPAERRRILVVSDASDDGTDEIVRRYADRGVTLLRRSERRGKAAGLNEAVRAADGEIVVFSDANAEFAPDAVRRLVENFADPGVGYVTGRLMPRHTGAGVAGTGGAGYLRFENWLRGIETRVHSVIGVNGGVDAMRRELYEDVPADQITDFVLPLRVIAAGRRVVFDPRARSTEEPNEEFGAEFQMRVRVALRALRGIWYMRRALDPRRHPWAAFAIFSHKILRYLGFLFLAAALVSSAILALHSGGFRILLLLQVAGYALALLAARDGRRARLGPLAGAAAYLVLANAAFAVATVRFIRGQSIATWRPRGG